MAAMVYWKNVLPLLSFFYLHTVVFKDTRIFVSLKMSSKSRTSQNKAFEQFRGASTKPDLRHFPFAVDNQPRGNAVRFYLIWHKLRYSSKQRSIIHLLLNLFLASYDYVFLVKS